MDWATERPGRNACAGFEEMFGRMEPVEEAT
jgi:hypothetical protein